MSSPTWIHIGMPKTGTKTLQKALFYHHSEIGYLGLYLHDRRRYSDCRDRDVETAYRKYIYRCDKLPGEQYCRDFYGRVIEPIVEAGQVPVFSWESLIENNLEVKSRRARNLKALFGHCKILVTLRHPIELVRSLYLQLLRRDNASHKTKWWGPIRFETIDEWVQKNWEKIGDAPQSQLEYPKSIRVFAEVFGEENIEIRLFEKLRTDSDWFHRSICEAMGISAEEGIRLTQDRVRNKRWTEGQYLKLQHLAESPWKSSFFRVLPPSIRELYIGRRTLRDQSDEAGFTPSISPEIQKEIESHTRHGNRWLMETWNLPLEKYDYPL